ncbi:hypothetical protein Tco_0631279 [Tanacetum coccineum]
MNNLHRTHFLLINLITPKWNVTITTRQVILLESVDSRELEITGGGMHGILETRMGAGLDKRRILRHWWTIDGEGVDWTTHSEDEDYALMACNSSDSDTEAYSQGLKKVEAQLVAHQQEAQKEKEDLKVKVEKWHNSSKNLSKLLNTQMSANDKFGLGYGDHRYDDGMHAVPPLMIGNYMPSGPDIELVLLGEKGKLLLSPQQVVVGDHKDTMVDPNTIVDPVLEIDYPHRALKNKGIVDSGCSRHMTGNKAYLDEFQDFNGGPVAFGGSRGYITGKGKIKTGKLDFEDVCFVKEL